MRSVKCQTRDSEFQILAFFCWTRLGIVPGCIKGRYSIYSAIQTVKVSRDIIQIIRIFFYSTTTYKVKIKHFNLKRSFFSDLATNTENMIFVITWYMILLDYYIAKTTFHYTMCFSFLIFMLLKTMPLLWHKGSQKHEINCVQIALKQAILISLLFLRG